MYQLLLKIYHKCSGLAFVRALGQMYRNGFPIGNLIAYFRIKKMCNKKSLGQSKITIVFLVQDLTIWNKLKSVYAQLSKDERFLTWLLAIPDDVTQSGEDNYGDIKKMYPNARVVDAKIENGWYDLRQIKPDYVFYQRPYDTYLPVQYRSANVVKYAKTCYLNYGYNFTDMANLSMAKIFFRNIHLFFAENEIYQKKNIDRFKYSHKKGYRKSFNLGYPAFQDFMSQQENVSGDNHYKVMWTPRWSEDVEVGGSNYFKFKEMMIDYIKHNEDTALIFRPHPMLFSHSLEVGRMTEDEVKEYLKIFSENDRFLYDTGKEYADKFWASDVLVTDFSSVIMEYYLTGKPIVYCPTGMKINPFFKDILSVNYVANNWNEVCHILDRLKSGQDELKEARQRKVEQFIGDYKNISKRFADAIYDDYNS